MKLPARLARSACAARCLATAAYHWYVVAEGLLGACWGLMRLLVRVTRCPASAGENIDVVKGMGAGWRCPACRDICNCR